MGNPIHTGGLIKKIIEQKNLSPTKMAVGIGIPNTAIYAYEKRSSIQTSILVNLCHAAKHNFFKDIANQFPNEYTQDATSSSEQEIVALKKEIERLMYENNLMRDLLKK
jgi:plasmid maintenance system antidote protein VapI